MKTLIANGIRASVITTTLAGVVACGGGYGGGGETGGGGGGGGGGGNTPLYTVGGAVSGLTGTGLKIRNNGSDLAISANGAFTFSPALAVGTTYAVTVVDQPTGPAQDCAVANGTGTIGTSNVTNVTINCAVKVMSVASSTPAPGATDVGRTTTATITFSVPLDATTVSANSVSLQSAAGEHPVSVSASGREITVTPSGKLMPHALYTITVSTAVRGSAGEILATPATVSFTSLDGQWQAPVPVETSTENTSGPRIAFDGQGNAFASWVQAGNINPRLNPMVNRYVPGEGWGTPNLLELDDVNSTNTPSLAVDPAGHALVAWDQEAPQYALAWTSSYSPDNGWRTPERIDIDSPMRGRAFSPQVAYDRDGNALAVWPQSDSQRLELWASRYTAGQGWGAPQRIDTDIGEVFYPQIAFDRQGNALVVWEQSDGARDNAWAIHYSPLEGWGTAQKIEAEDSALTSSPQIAFEPNGNAMAVWAQIEAGGARVWANRYAAGTGWGTPTKVQQDAVTKVTDVHFAFDAHGDALAVWRQADATIFSAWSSRYTAADGWNTPQPIESVDKNVSATGVGLDANGNGLAVWLQADGTRTDLWANRYSAGTGWGTPHLLETANAGNAIEPQIAVDSNGNAMAVWSQYDGSTYRLWSSRFE
jgi:hypothetical protein